jgi:hypothetical protein
VDKASLYVTARSDYVPPSGYLVIDVECFNVLDALVTGGCGGTNPSVFLRGSFPLSVTSFAQKSSWRCVFSGNNGDLVQATVVCASP